MVGETGEASSPEVSDVGHPFFSGDEAVGFETAEAGPSAFFGGDEAASFEHGEVLHDAGSADAEGFCQVFYGGFARAQREHDVPSRWIG